MGLSKVARLAKGNATGIAYVRANPGTYTLFTEAEKNASDLASRNTALAEGNATGIAYVQANPSLYSLYTQLQLSGFEDVAREEGFAEGRTMGVESGLASVRAELASGGLSSLTYLSELKSKPHTQGWYYQPEWGWLWTNDESFPLVYKAGIGDSTGTWLYFSQLADQPEASFYDYSQSKWVKPLDD